MIKFWREYLIISLEAKKETLIQLRQINKSLEELAGCVSTGSDGRSSFIKRLKVDTNKF